MASGPLDRYRTMVSDGALSADPAQRAAAEKLDQLWRQLDAGAARRLWSWASSAPPVRGLYLYGGVGRGKTMLMDMFYGAVHSYSKRRVHFNAFMAGVHDQISTARSEHPGDPIPIVAAKLAQTAKLLCLDEFQVTDIADATILGRLFDGLFDAGVVLVTTSNSAPRDLYADGLNRSLFLPFIARLEAATNVLDLGSGHDYRLAKLRGQRLWFSPLGSAADVAMEQAWQRLTAGAQPSEQDFIVKGHHFVVPRLAMGTAFLDFSEACGKPLGSGDYLTLAQACHTVLLANIPALTADRRNEARRFITLIDTLYDTRTRLIASAAAEPHALYPAGDGATAFARTASRLIDMRSDAYLAGARLPAGSISNSPVANE
jgi:cell division protein ZapE